MSDEEEKRESKKKKRKMKKKLKIRWKKDKSRSERVWIGYVGKLKDDSIFDIYEFDYGKRTGFPHRPEILFDLVTNTSGYNPTVTNFREWSFKSAREAKMAAQKHLDIWIEKLIGRT
jgi:hypothetical protein